MFGKEQPTVVTEEEVGDFVAELHRTTVQPLDEVLDSDDTHLVRRSTKATTRPQD
jgi:hypothetical protein